MSGRPPIDRVREAQDAPAINDEHRERVTQKQAELDAAGPPDEGPFLGPAALTSAEVQVLDRHKALEHAGGVGALLRYRPG